MLYTKIDDLDRKVIKCASDQEWIEFLSYAYAHGYSLGPSSIITENGKLKYFSVESDTKTITALLAFQSGLNYIAWSKIKLGMFPRICRLLNVMVGEPFRIEDEHGAGPNCTYYINGDGTFETKPAKYAGSSIWLMKAIDDPTMVHCVKRFNLTDEEKYLIRELYKEYPYSTIERKKGTVYWKKYPYLDDIDCFNYLPSSMFQSIPEGESLIVSDHYEEEIPF